MANRPRFESIVLACIDPMAVTGSAYFSFGVRRIQAALVASPRLAGRSVELIEFGDADVEGLTAAIEAHDPDLVGISAFVWSFATFVAVARRLKERRPDRMIVFGGPSARTAVFDLEPWRDAHRWIDVLVLGEGEQTMERIVAEAPTTVQEFADIGGVAIATDDGWKTLGGPARVTDLGALPSPYVLGLTPHEGIATFESFRGCPLACSFCQWGEPSQTARVFSYEYIAAELRAIRDTRPKVAALADAALNLNPRAFRNLAAAEREVGGLRGVPLLVEVYPLGLNAEHLAFLSGMTLAQAGIGLQSFDPEVLRRMERPFDPARFERTVRQAADIGPVTIEFIFGLPGDTPDSFWRTYERARKLPASLRAYRCLILPDALLTRMPPGCTADFDPGTLQVRSCTGWTEDDLARTAEQLSQLSAASGGQVHQGYWWDLPAEVPAHRPKWYSDAATRGEGGGPAIDDRPLRPGLDPLRGRMPSIQGRSVSGGGQGAPPGAKPGGRDVGPRPEAALGRETPEAPALAEARPHPATEAMRSAVSQETGGAWQLERMDVEDGVVQLDVLTGEGPLLVSVAPAESGRAYLCLVDGLAVSYRVGPRAPTPAMLKLLPTTAFRLRALLRPLLASGTASRASLPIAGAGATPASHAPEAASPRRP